MKLKVVLISLISFFAFQLSAHAAIRHVYNYSNHDVRFMGITHILPGLEVAFYDVVLPSGSTYEYQTTGLCEVKIDDSSFYFHGHNKYLSHYGRTDPYVLNEPADGDVIIMY